MERRRRTRNADREWEGTEETGGNDRMTECLSRTYENKLRKVEKRIGKPEGDHLRILRNMTRRKVRKFVFKQCV